MKILFVCTGNTCRSPMAEAIFRDMADRRGLKGEILCQSAGLSPVARQPAAENAVLACREIGVELSGHRARKLRAQEIPEWDFFFVMSGTQAYILRQAGVEEGRIYLPKEIADPYGGSLSDYRRCRDLLRRELEIFLDKLPVGKAAPTETSCKERQDGL